MTTHPNGQEAACFDAADLSPHTRQLLHLRARTDAYYEALRGYEPGRVPSGHPVREVVRRLRATIRTNVAELAAPPVLDPRSRVATLTPGSDDAAAAVTDVTTAALEHAAALALLASRLRLWHRLVQLKVVRVAAVEAQRRAIPVAVIVTAMRIARVRDELVAARLGWTGGHLRRTLGIEADNHEHVQETVQRKTARRIFAVLGELVDADTGETLAALLAEAEGEGVDATRARERWRAASADDAEALSA